MIEFVADYDAFQNATARLTVALDERVQQGFEATLESIAARAKETTTFVDRTGALRNSIQSDGVTGGGGQPMVGTISFAAVSERSLRKKRGNTRRSMGGGEPYGIFLELGTVHIKERRFIRDAIEAEDGALIESSMRLAFRDVGFEVA